MKGKIKILKCFVVVVFIFTFFKEVNAVKISEKFIEEQTNYYFVDSSLNGKTFELFKKESDGNPAYLFTTNQEGFTSSFYGDDEQNIFDSVTSLNLSEEQLEQVLQIVYYGYGYEGRMEIEWYVATQSLIWKSLGVDFHFVSQIGINQANYLIEIPQEIEIKTKEIERNLKKPEIHNSTLNIVNGTSYFYKNELLEHYEVMNTQNGLTIYYKKNELAITPYGTKGGDVWLRKNFDQYAHKAMIYQNDNHQGLLVPGNIEKGMDLRFHFNVVQNSVNIKKYDSINQSCKAQEQSSLSGSVYGLYWAQTDSFIKDIPILDDCNVYLYDVTFGEYYLKEKVAGKNYKLDETKHYFNVDASRIEQEIILYGEPLMAKAFIDFTNENGKSISVSDGIFGLYKKDGTLVEKVDLNGSTLSFTDLLIGEYYLQMIEAPKGFQLNSEKQSFAIDATSFSSPVHFKYSFTSLKIPILISKMNKRYGMSLPDSNCELEIYQNGILVSTIKTDKNGEISIQLENGNYTIKEKIPREGYRLMKEQEFVVNNQNTISLSLVSEPIVGSIFLQNFDFVTGQPLINAKYEVCTMEHQCLYTGATLEDGSLFIPNIEYGKYYLKEIQAPNGYALNETPIYFEINNEEKQFLENDYSYQEVIVPSTGIYKKSFAPLLILCFLLGSVLYKKLF